MCHIDSGQFGEQRENKCDRGRRLLNDCKEKDWSLRNCPDSSSIETWAFVGYHLLYSATFKFPASTSLSPQIWRLLAFLEWSSLVTH